MHRVTNSSSQISNIAKFLNITILRNFKHVTDSCTLCKFCCLPEQRNLDTAREGLRDDSEIKATKGDTKPVIDCKGDVDCNNFMFNHSHLLLSFF